MIRISKAKATELMHNSKGKVFGVRFIKRTTGESRNMSARLGVRKYLKNPDGNDADNGLRFSPSKRNLQVVFDMNKGQYRMVNLDGLTNLKINKEKFEVITAEQL